MTLVLGMVKQKVIILNKFVKKKYFLLCQSISFIHCICYSILDLNKNGKDIFQTMYSTVLIDILFAAPHLLLGHCTVGLGIFLQYEKNREYIIQAV